jgi:pimeloyl-ACP methyl ester carboxylesterase
MKNFRWLAFALLVIGGSISGLIQAQTIDDIFNKFIKRYHIYQGTTLPYYIFVPATYNPQIHYPLMLCLHGAGERGDDPSAVKKNSMATVWARDSNQIRWPCFILVPQCPSNGWWTNSNTMLTINDILDSLQLEFSIDTNRLYITGLSMGGYGTWDMIVRYPTKFAAAVPMSGGGDPFKAALIKHIPIWDFHGAMDATVNVAYSREMITALENEGDTVIYTNCHNGDCTGLSDSALVDKIKHDAKLLYTEYEYGGHVIWDQAYNTIFLLPWVFSQTKLLTPTGTERENVSSFPIKSNLSQNFPNPFNPSTEIRFSVGTYGFTSLRVYDVLGREVAILVNEKKSAGTYTVTWNAAANMPSGVYFYRLSVGSFAEVKKLVLLK